MRVNVYAEEMTDRIEIISKEIDGHTFTGLRVYLELPATVGGQQYQGPFMHRPGDDDSGAVTFWGKRDLRTMLRKALACLDEHYAERGSDPSDGCLCGEIGWRHCQLHQDEGGPSAQPAEDYRAKYEAIVVRCRTTAGPCFCGVHITPLMMSEGREVKP